MKDWPKSLEVQGHFGEAGSVFGVRGANIKGAKRGVILRDRPLFGDWDRYEITSQDGKVTVRLNGELVNEGYDAQPAQGTSACSPKAGRCDIATLRSGSLRR